MNLFKRFKHKNTAVTPLLVKPAVMPSNFDYVFSYEEGIERFNKLQVGKEYELLDLVTGEWKKQTYQPPNEQETFEKMMHGIRYDWIRP